MSRLLMMVCAGLISCVWTSTSHADSQLNVVVILDNSGSMQGQMRGGQKKIDGAKSALLKVLDQSPATSQVGVLLLNPGPKGEWLIPLGPIDRSTLSSAVSSLGANGGTPLGAKMKVAADALLKLRNEYHYGTYKMLVVSDGEANDPQLVQEYLPAIQARGILVDVIGVAMAQQHSLATQTSTYRNADDPNSLAKAIGDIVLGESSADASDAAGQSDFDLLAGLPDQVAVASLTALTTPSNEPIEASKSLRTTDNNTNASTRTHTRSTPPTPQSQPKRENESPFSMFKILVFLFIFAAIFRAVVSGLKSKR